MRALWEHMVSLGDNGWFIFEAYTRELMIKPPFQLSCRTCCGKNDEGYSNHFDRTFGGCTKIRPVDNITEATLTRSNVVFHSIRSQFRLIDFIYTDDQNVVHAFQVTIGKKHPAKEADIRELVAAVKGKTLMLYYLVLPPHFFELVTAPAKPSMDGCSIFHVLVPKPQEYSTT